MRAFLCAAFFWCVLIEVAEAAAYSLFRMELDGDWYLILTGTSLAECLQFARMYAPHLAAASAVLAVTAAWAVYLTFFARRKTFFRFFAVAAVLMAVRVGCVGSVRAWKPLYVAFDTLRSAREYGKVGEAGRWTCEREAAVRAPREGATNYVFVIGESLSASRVPFLGYEKETMPRLASLGKDLAVYGPVRAASPYTVRSLIELFVSGAYSAPVLFRMAGYRTGYVSAHDRWGRYCSVEAAVFAACERKIYLSDDTRGEIYDGQILPHAVEMMKREPFALFIHMIGSHFEPGRRVPEGYAEGEGLDDYDRSVRYTDEVLGRLIKSLPPRTELIYISDHGESVDRSGWRDLSSPALWNVPVFVYPSQASAEIKSVADFVEAWRARAAAGGASADGGEDGGRNVGE